MSAGMAHNTAGYMHLFDYGHLWRSLTRPQIRCHPDKRELHRGSLPLADERYMVSCWHSAPRSLTHFA